MDDQDQQPQSWDAAELRFMRRFVLDALRVDGAMTLEELDRYGVEVLGLRLQRDELIVFLDSARRHQLVEPLASPPVVDSLDTVSDQWVITQAAKRELSGGVNWSSGVWSELKTKDGFALLLSVAGPVVAYEQTHVIVVPVELLTLVLIVLVLARCAYLRKRGAPKRQIAVAWHRFERERSESQKLILAHGDPTSVLLVYLVCILFLVARVSQTVGTELAIALGVGAFGHFLLRVPPVITARRAVSLNNKERRAGQPAVISRTRRRSS